MSYELKVDDLDDKSRKILSDILVDEGMVCPRSDEELIALLSLINGEHLSQKHSSVTTA